MAPFLNHLNDNNATSKGLETDMESLKIATFNVNGLASSKFKKRAIMASLKKCKFDIIALQETHFVKEDYETFMKKNWKGPIIYSEGSTNSKGICILFNNNFQNDKIKVLFLNERFILCSMEIGFELFFIGNVYAPNDKKSKLIFFNFLEKTIKDKLNDEQQKRLIVMGDFNCVMNNSKDIISGGPHPIETVQSLNTFVNNSDLNDLWRSDNMYEKNYTFSRGIGTSLVARRLDYIFANNYLVPFLNNCKILTLPHSDHRAVFLNLEFFKFRRGKGTYKMNDKLFEDSIFKETVRKLIRDNILSLEGLDPILKWNIIKARIRELCQQYGKFNKLEKTNEIKNVRDKLNELENQLANDIDNLEIQNKVVSLKKKLELFNIEKTEAARIRSKTKWIEEGEKCSAYFLSLEKSRALSSTVFRLKNNDDSYTTDENEIVETFAKHFSNVYNDELIEEDTIDNSMEIFLDNVTLKKITTDESIFIDRDISIQEIKLALDGLNKKSSPGYDGLSMEFYCLFFNDIKELLFEYYQYCFLKGGLDEQTQLGLISLIHKGKSLSRDEVKNWRPITLSNIDYKIIAKLLANRIKIVINNIVGKQQQGFIKGRNIANIIRGIDDVLEYERHKDLNDLLFVIDFKQAFDKINNYYLLKVFKMFGFGEVFIKWLKTILSNRKSCVKNGGHLSSFFNVNCGVKQGCPIAPLLFVLGAELLAQNIIQDDSIVGVQYPLSESQTKVLQFADDTTFFCKQEIDIREILSRIKLFGEFSGLKINRGKCSVMVMGRHNNTQENFESIKVEDEVKIVGIFFRSDTSAGENKKNWEGRVEKMKKIINTWMRRKLTIIGKIQIVKTFLLSQLVYVFQSIAIPSKVIDEINTILYRFIWKKNNLDKKAWERVKRKVLCNSKEKGGLCMIDLKKFQDSFLIEWAVKLLTEKNEKWTHIPNYLLQKLGGIEVFKSDVELKDFKGEENIQSPFWKKVVHAWIEHNVSKNTEKININDPINNNTNLTVNKKSLYLKSSFKGNIIQIKDAMQDGEIISFETFENKVGAHPDNVIDFLAMRTAISKIKNKITYDEENQPILFRNLDCYKIKRKKIYESILTEENCFCEKMWENKTGHIINSNTWSNIFIEIKEIKLQEIQWKILHNVFPTNILLTRMGLQPSEKCKFCNDTDFVEHYFFYCPRIHQFWNYVNSYIHIKIGKRLTLSKHEIILGLIPSKYRLSAKEKSWISNLLTVAKLAIIKSKSDNINVNLIFDSEISIRKL